MLRNMSGYKVNYERVAKLKEQGCTNKVISERLGCTPIRVRQILRRPEAELERALDLMESREDR